MHYASQHVLSLKEKEGMYLYSYRFAYELLDVMICRLLVVRFFMRRVLQASRLNSKLIKSITGRIDLYMEFTHDKFVRLSGVVLV